MAKRQTNKRVPSAILISDARNDAALERAIARLPRGAALVFRHYHLPPAERRARFEALRKLARLHRIAMIGARVPRSWRADGVYGTPAEIAGARGLRLATAHSLSEIGAATRAGAHAILLSPVYATRSHPGALALGAPRFLMLARHSSLPVIALGGMTRARAARLPVHGWAAIDGRA
ncbi:thiamine-phosphate pyrophosphorylase [Novosphingobium hassiacum]|uniref:Thiamine-phosphate pyrophosphorylase n=1 Tax=Novosphingobium hassiacum TaxID=173676 RepID=A0A7W5ZYR7_9SPHN|nr:thiamine phosphate synthase [Novosphingobium hassiacum]MBB3860160.1 thiamine-phosphate pyrophosphorylase [Novosphingobium hassiacum]